jgi:hypothetical protein
MLPPALIVAFVACVSSHAVGPAPTILDTDIGTDFDDTFALVYILSRPDLFDLKLVQLSSFNTTKRAQVCAQILAALGRFDVPIGIGRYTGEQAMPQYAFASDYSLDDFVAAGGTISVGTDHLAALMAGSDPTAPTMLIEIAPAVSVGDVLASNASLSSACVMTAMSGSIYHGYGNSSSADAEYNVKTDIGASQLIYASNWVFPLLTAPLDTTVFAQFGSSPPGTGGAEYASLLAANTTDHPYVQTFLANYVAWYAGGGSRFGAMRPFSPSTGTSTMYDLQAAVMGGLYAQALAKGSGSPPPFSDFVTQALPLFVDAGGFTRIGNTSADKVVFAATRFPAAGGVVSAVDAFAADAVAALIVGPRIPFQKAMFGRQ